MDYIITALVAYQILCIKFALMKKNSLKYISFEALFYNLYFHLCIISHQFLPFYMQTNKDYINMVDWLFIIVPFHALSRETLETALTHYGE